MTSGGWDRVEQLFQRAIERPAAERKAFVRREAAGDQWLIDEVLSLLDYDETPNTGLGQAVRSMAALVVEETEIDGQRIGIYRIERKLGEGGMGSVYLGVRDDGEFSKQVAVKVVRPGMETPQFVDRFRRERQILANLDHPYVARLLDGGAAVLPGRRVPIPFLVMEYVDGLPIHKFCQQSLPRIADRCRLFQKVCEAVSYAHSRLIIHRDLKPGNILVATDGTPKLLDFGIAQLMEQAEGADANPARRQLTIDYASPEQVRGENAGIGTDVYSLGAVFYELLTGIRPHQFRSYSAPEVERVICKEAVRPPSDAAPDRAADLRGELDSIVARAMRKNPAERYGTVEEFRRDIERYLTGFPVEAFNGGARYRARKFVTRHRWAVAGAAVAVVGLTVGTAGALWQAHQAVEARHRAEAAAAEAQEAHATEQVQRRRAEEAAGLASDRQRAAELAQAVADSQRAEAERRFLQVRELANRLLFEYQDDVAALPGSTAVRKKMVETGLAYFDTLAKDANLGPQVRLEMVDGWRRLGDIQGNPYVSNLGDIKEALASYDRALRLAESLGDGGRRQRAQLLLSRGAAYSHSGNFAAAERDFQLAQQLTERAPALDNTVLATVFEYRADLLERQGRLTDAIPIFDRAIAIGSGDAQFVCYHKAATILARTGQIEKALDYDRRVLALTEAAAITRPTDPRLLRIRVWVLMAMADTYRLHWRSLKVKAGETLVWLERALEVQERLRAVEPFNQQNVRDWIALEHRASSGSLSAERFEDAARHASRAIEASEAFRRLAPGMTQGDLLLGISHIRRAKAYTYLKRYQDADDSYDAGRKALDVAYQRNPNDSVVRRERFYLARDRYVNEWEKAHLPKPAGDLRLSLAYLREAIALQTEILKREPNAAIIAGDTGEMHANLATLLAELGQRQDACAPFAIADRYRRERKLPLRASEIEAFREMDEKLPECKVKQ